MILDLYHALERLHELCEGLYGADNPWAERMGQTWTGMLKNDRVVAVIAAARRRLEDLELPPDHALEKQIAYFENHQDKMLYKTYRDQGLFYGSGQIRHRPAAQRIGNVLDASWSHQRIELAPGSQKQPLGRMLGPPQQLPIPRNHNRRLISGYFTATHPKSLSERSFL